VFATRTHFDYHSEAAVADLQQWLAEAGLSLHGVHAPIGLDIGAQSAEEIAMAILAEIVATRYGRSGGPLGRQAAGG